MKNIRLGANMLAVAGIGAALVSTLMTGCEKPPPPPPPVVVAPPPPPPPEPVTLEPILAQAKPDARVQFPQERAPVDESLAQAVIDFADGFAKADAGRLGAKMDSMTNQVLDQLSGSGTLEDEMKKAEAVRVVYLMETAIEGTNASGAQLVLAIQDPGSSYLLGWNVTKAEDKWIFAAMPTLGETRPRASDWDGMDISVLAAGSSAFVSAPVPTAGEDASADAAAPEGEKSEGEEKPDDGGKTVRTPAGPVKIPGGG